MRSVPALVSDWGTAAGVAATLLATGLSGPSGGSPHDLIGGAFLVGGGLALAARRRSPVGVLIATAGCVLGYQVAGFAVPPLALMVAVYAATRAGRRTVTLAVVALVLAAQPVLNLASPGGVPAADGLSHVAVVLGWIVASGLAGEAVWQAERRAAEAERNREEIARRREDEERLRIARELHDSLTHQISVVTVQAGVAVHLARKRGEEVSSALLAIEEAGREAARELRATLDALRADGRTPSPGLAAVEELVARTRSAGVATTLTVEGERPDLPAAVDRAAYRIVQEALTNVVRHASQATASVRISYQPEALTVRVDDDGTATPGADHVPGVGLIGMRERVAALGGRLHAGSRAAGGFTVQADLPLGGRS